MIVKNILKKVFVFLVLSASFLTLNSKDTFANVVSEQNEIASKLVRNVKEVGNDRYYKGDFYSDVGTYPEGMFLVVEKLIEKYSLNNENIIKIENILRYNFIQKEIIKLDTLERRKNYGKTAGHPRDFHSVCRYRPD